VLPSLPVSVTLRRVSTIDALVGALRAQILGGMLAPGTPLREAELCELFGVSRHSVRTGLQALAHEGIVRHEPNRGAYVAKLSAEDVADIYRLRLALEADAVRTLAAGDHEALAPVHAATEALAAIDVRDAAGWSEVARADLAFHQALIDALGSPRISRAYGALLAEMALCLLQHRRDRDIEDLEAMVEEHTRILAAIEHGDGDAAVAELEQHLMSARDAIVGVANGQRFVS
jgi:DNA-binding GntR family transcriptional regulator